jgi:hypothetical protein
MDSSHAVFEKKKLLLQGTDKELNPSSTISAMHVIQYYYPYLELTNVYLKICRSYSISDFTVAY